MVVVFVDVVVSPPHPPPFSPLVKKKISSTCMISEREIDNYQYMNVIARDCG